MQQFAFPYELSLKTQMPEAAQRLIDAAESAIGNAPADGGFDTGAALLLSDGTTLTAGSGDGLCAEQRLLAMHDAGGPVHARALSVTFRTVAGGGQSYSICGTCRQRILELQRRQNTPITVYMAGSDGQVIMVENADFLLPFHSGAKNL